MFTKENTKIFIDTNIFLGLYNSNEAGNVKIFLHSLFKNKSILITTEQAINEYLRNRTRVINELKTSFLATSDRPYASSFITSLKGYKEYQKCSKELKNHRKNVINRIDEILEDPKQDDIYNSFMKLWKSGNTVLTKDEYINLAVKRKILGNPPGGDKYSNCDEVIWESLLNTITTNLIVVSKDHTYTQNKEYLQYEYKQKTDKDLLIYDATHKAFSMLGIQMDQRAIEAEDNIRWLDIIIQAFKQLGGKATLVDIYDECKDLVTLFHQDKQGNANIESTIRRTIYQHSSDVTAYLGKNDLFHRVDSGLWELR
ncbi:PIN domain-containing protein [Phascolarctobacterium faecium]|jgi:hypothetical protein|uniref:PIN domain-containing protein n=1 Tax=Phascolarctobacterium faecium TaxID=33025 RepID=UPI0024306856|nr:PIN domain-containing protein [Phascolarctobacterium faecium]MBS1316763.1 DUF4935 domain-containing protein [Acidaminococcaceae bacterium]